VPVPDHPAYDDWLDQLAAALAGYPRAENEPDEIIEWDRAIDPKTDRTRKFKAVLPNLRKLRPATYWIERADPHFLEEIKDSQSFRDCVAARFGETALLNALAMIAGRRDFENFPGADRIRGLDALVEELHGRLKELEIQPGGAWMLNALRTEISASRAALERLLPLVETIVTLERSYRAALARYRPARPPTPGKRDRPGRRPAMVENLFIELMPRLAPDGCKHDRELAKLFNDLFEKQIDEDSYRRRRERLELEIRTEGCR
jgi:hypothetical protein